jgi:hypothetical protein
MNFGLAILPSDLIGLIIAVLVVAYLGYVLIRAEKL